MEHGFLYDPNSPLMNWISYNDALGLKTRWFDIAIPPIAELPHDPEELLDPLAERALTRSEAEIEFDDRRLPPHEHARPYHDLPEVFHGRTFFDLRPRIATALFLQDDYREWVFGKLGEEAAQDLDDLRRRFGRLAPTASEDAIELALELSEEAREIRRRFETPSKLDLSRFLSGWLGDLPAADLLLRWEKRHVDALVRGADPDFPSGAFEEGWREIHRLLWVPSYTRSLTLMSPVHSLESDRIGFWRVTLPSPNWIATRMRGDVAHPYWSNLPLDLIPTQPLAYFTVDRLIKEHPELADHLRSEGFGVVDLDYELLTKPSKQHPRTAFREAMVSIVLASGTQGQEKRLRVEAKIHSLDELTELKAIRLDPQGDAGRKTSPGRPRLAAEALSRSTQGRLHLALAGRSAADLDGGTGSRPT